VGRPCRLGPVKPQGILVRLLCLAAVTACQSPETKQCIDSFTSAQGTVNKIDPADTASVESSLAAVDKAIAACNTAGRTTERDELTQAKNQLAGHLDDLRAKQNRVKKPKLSPDELAALVRNGDPNCPKGQAYRDADLKKEVRCTGPVPIGMNFAQAKAYFDARNYKLTVTDSPPALRAEYGAELLLFTFAAPNDPNPAKCLTIYPPPGESWEEATARLTGVLPKRLEKATTVPTDHGALALHVDNSDTKVLIQVGDCGAEPVGAGAPSAGTAH